MERFDVKIDGKTETVETNLPWMLATDAEGEEHFYVGPAALDRDVEGEVLDSWAGPEPCAVDVGPEYGGGLVV